MGKIMINIISKTGIVLGVALLASSIVSANKTEAVSTNNNAINTTLNNAYTAHGTMSKKTALMVKYLLRNPHLKVSAVLSKPAQHSNQAMAQKNTFSYTVTGTTDRKTALKLKRMFQQNKHISISATVSRPTQSVETYTTYYPGYTPFYYKGTPPVYREGNTVWYPVKIEEQPVADSQISRFNEPYPMTYSNMMVGK
jgi:hypothetical protein